MRVDRLTLNFQIEELKKKVKDAQKSAGGYSLDISGKAFAVLSFDEFGPIELRPEEGSNWAREKHPDRVPATYHREKGTKQLLVAYDLGQDRTYAHMEDHKTNVEFLAFLKYLRSIYPSIRTPLHDTRRRFSSRRGQDTRLRVEAEHRVRIHAHERLVAESDRATLQAVGKFTIGNFNPTNHKEISRNVRRYIA